MQEEHIFPTTCKLPCGYARDQVIRCGSCKYSSADARGDLWCRRMAEWVEPGCFCWWAEPVTAEQACQNSAKNDTAQTLQPRAEQACENGNAPCSNMGA